MRAGIAASNGLLSLACLVALGDPAAAPITLTYGYDTTTAPFLESRLFTTGFTQGLANSPVTRDAGSLGSIYLDRLHPALLPLLQRADVSVSLSTAASAINFVAPPVDVSLSADYALRPLAALGLPSATTSVSGGASVSSVLPPLSLVGADLSLSHSFSGTSALPFVGLGRISPFDVLFGVRATMTPAAGGGIVNVSAGVSGSASVQYQLDEPTQEIAVQYLLPIDNDLLFRIRSSAGATVGLDETGAPGGIASASARGSGTLSFPGLDAALRPYLRRAEVEIDLDFGLSAVLQNPVQQERVIDVSVANSITLAPGLHAPGSLAAVYPQSFSRSVQMQARDPFESVDGPVNAVEFLRTFGLMDSLLMSEGFSVALTNDLLLSVSTPEPTGVANGVVQSGRSELITGGIARVTYVIGPRDTAVREPSTPWLLLLGAVVLSVAARVKRTTLRSVS